MKTILQSSPEERLRILHKALRGKVRHIPETVLQRVVLQLNTKQIYCIKATQSFAKFQNIATSECVATSSRKAFSIVTVLYGDYTPGHFQQIEKEKHSVSGILLKDGPVIALKRAIYDNGAGFTKTYTLAIYDCA